MIISGAVVTVDGTMAGGGAATACKRAPWREATEWRDTAGSSSATSWSKTARNRAVAWRRSVMGIVTPAWRRALARSRLMAGDEVTLRAWTIVLGMEIAAVAVAVYGFGVLVLLVGAPLVVASVVTLAVVRFSEIARQRRAAVAEDDRPAYPCGLMSGFFDAPTRSFVGSGISPN